MGYIEFTVHKDRELLQKSLPLLLIDGVYTRNYESILVNNKEYNENIENQNVKSVKITYGDNVKGLRFCNTSDSDINYISRVNQITHIDTEFFTDMSLMFNNCRYLTKLDLNKLKTDNVTNMRSLFSGCCNLEELKIDKWNVENVEDMDCMFAGCVKLPKLDINSWNTPKLIDTSWMFYRCNMLTELKMESFVTHNVKKYNNMFEEINPNVVVEVSSNKFVGIPNANPDIEFKTTITCEQIILDKEEYLALDVFNVSYSIIPFNTNTGKLEVICTPNIKMINETEFVIDPALGMEGTITFKHGYAQTTAKVTYKRYIEYTVDKLFGKYLDEDATLPYIYYLNGNDPDRNYMKSVVYMEDGTTKEDDMHVKLVAIEKVRLYYDKVGIAGIKFYNPDNRYSSTAVREINYIDTTGFTDCSYMFYNAQHLDRINLDMFSSKGITNTKYMFHNCSIIQEIKLESWSSEKIIEYERMFSNVNPDCKIYVGENWYLSEFDTNFDGRFIGLIVACRDIILSSERIILDEGSTVFKFSYTLVPSNTRDEVTVTKGDAILGGLYNQYTIDISIRKESYIEVSCGNITKRCNIEYSDMPFIEYTVDNTKDRLDRGVGDYLDYGTRRRVVDEEEIIETVSSTIPSLLLKDGTYYEPEPGNPNKRFSKRIIVLNDGTETNNLHTPIKDIKLVKLYYDDPNGNVKGIKFYDGKHDYESYVKKITYVNTKNFINMDRMFYRCTSMTEFDQNSIDTRNADSMSYMFANSGIENLDLSNINTSKVINFESMFSGCTNMKTLKVNNWDTRKGTFMTNMFMNCNRLESIDLRSFDTHACTDIRMMFSGCTNLKEIKFGTEFNTAGCNSLSSLFYNCESLETIDLSPFDTANVTSLNSTFRGCKSLKSLDLTSINTSKLTSLASTFQDCSNLKLLNLNRFVTTGITDMSDCFKGCSSLQRMDLRNFQINIINSTPMSILGMFDGCTSMQAIEFTSFTTESLHAIDENHVYTRLFRDVPNTCEIYTNVNWMFNENECGFSGFFNSRRTSYEANRTFEYCIGYDIDNTKLGDEEDLPSAITVIRKTEHTFTMSDKYKGLVSTNQNCNSVLSHKCYKIDLTHATNDNIHVYIEAGLSCNSDLYDKFIIAISTDPNIPNASFATGMITETVGTEDDARIVMHGTEKRKMSYTYYKDRIYKYSTRIGTRNVFYLHFVYTKDSHPDYLDDYALIKYIKFKTDSSYFEGSHSEITPIPSKTNYDYLLDFTNPTHTMITSSNNLPKWIKTGYNSRYPMISAYKNQQWSLTTTNFNLDSTNSDRYFRFMLTELTKSVTITITYRISTQSQADYFAIHLTKTDELPSITSTKNRIIRDSGMRYSKRDRTVSTVIDQPGIYYLHFNYVKDASTRNGYDTVMIKSIEITEEK